MIQRRGFLAGMLALGLTPAIVTSKGFLPTFEPRVWGEMFLNLNSTYGKLGESIDLAQQRTIEYSSARTAMENHWRMLREQREAMNRFGDVDKMIKGIVQDILRK